MLAGQITVASGSVLNLSGAAEKLLLYPAEIHNHGTVNWSGAGTVQNVTGNGVSVRNYSDGVVTITADAGLYVSLAVHQRGPAEEDRRDGHACT